MNEANGKTERVALITGAGSGLGKGAAEVLAARDIRVGVLSRTATQVRSVADEINAAGGEAMPLVADVSRYDEVAEAVKELVGRWGRLDMVFAMRG